MNRFLLIAAAVTLLSACDNAAMEEKVNQLQAQNIALKKDTKGKEAALTSFVASLNEIEKNLKEIRAREMNIELSRQEDVSSERTQKRIKNDIEEIESLMAKNRATIKDLNAQLAQSDKKSVRLNSSMQRLKDNLAGQLDKREAQVSELLSELEGMEFQVGKLRASVDSLQKDNEEKLAEMNSAYFVVGDFRALHDQEIVDKKGGFLGLLGRTETLADNFAQHDKFIKINKHEAVSFPLDGRGVKLVTAHPADSYRIESDHDTQQMNLVISDPDRFWESSKYLVAVTKGS